MIGDLAMRLLHAVVAGQISAAPLPPEDLKSVACLAQNLWFETRGSSETDKMAVANVVLNRVVDPRYPNDICEVIWQPHQFSWTNDGKSDQVRVMNPIDRAAWKRIVAISIDAVSGTLEDPTAGATHFHATYVTPGWAQSLYRIVQIDQHIYYRYP
ncbi:MAG: cell wall hydrolase [Geminicoccaceae bacterium]|nr:MAG: cell wall hydrolase [Geminicoccaceae bacterium]